MQRVVEDQKREQKAINDKKMMAVNSAEDESDQALKKAKDDKEEKLAAMQRNFRRLPFLRQVYHEAPDDVFELIVSKCRQFDEIVWGLGGLNAFRLANKRFKQVVESCTTMIVSRRREDGPNSLPVNIIQKCRRIETIRCESHNLMSLEGCPDGLRTLWIGRAPHLPDLSPLASSSMMKHLLIQDSSITDISVVALMPLLEMFVCEKDPESSSIKDLSPLASCPRMRLLWLGGNEELKDLSPLSSCAALEDLYLIICRLITSLDPLSSLRNLKKLHCRGIDPRTSLLPLASCTGIGELMCMPDAVDLEELRNRMPQVKVIH